MFAVTVSSVRFQAPQLSEKQWPQQSFKCSNEMKLEIGTVVPLDTLCIL